MFLNRMRSHDGEEGGALVAVLGAMAVVSVLCATILSNSLGAMRTSTTTLAGAQSSAAAEAGVDATELVLRSTMGCVTAGGVVSSASTPSYRATVSYLDGGGWHVGCPDGHSATQVKIVSVGTARDKGVSGASAGDSATLEAVYPYTPASSSITGTGGAFFGGSTNTLNNVTVTNTTTLTPGGSTPDVVVTNGSFSCQGNKTIAGNLIVTNGSVDLSGCIVLGSIKASGYVHLNSGANQVGGDIVAAGLNVASGTKGVTINQGANVTGSVTTVGGVSLGGIVGGSIVSVGNAASDLISSSVKVGGSLTLGGTLNFGTIWSAVYGATSCILSLNLDLSCALRAIGVVGGATVQNATGITAPTAPATPSWPGYTYSASDWGALGYQIVPWQGSCQVNNLASTQAFLLSVAAMTVPTVVDARACGRVQISSSAALTLSLHSNVAFIGNGFDLQKLTINAASGLSGLSTWVLVPGTSVIPNVSACLNVDFGSMIELNSTVSIGNGVKGLLYTPGCIHNANPVVLSGQEYAGYISMGESVSIDYQPVGLPGTSLDGTAVASVRAASLGTRTSLRQITGG